jgi:signal transduction histidine kinase
MKPRRVTILRKGLLVLALPLLYQALFIGLLMKRQGDHNQAQSWAAHTKDVLVQTDFVYRLLLTSQSNLRAFLLTKNELFAEELSKGDQQIASELARLRSMVQDNPKQQERFERVVTRTQARLDYERWITALVKNGELEQVQEELRKLSGQPLMEALRKEIESFRETEEKLDDQRIEGLRQSNITQNWLLLGGLIVNVGIGALAASMFSREISGRISVVTENTRRIADGEALPPLVAGSDEIRELDEQFHLLADHLKSSQLRERVYQEALERRAAELTRANDDLGQKNKEIEMFVYSVSHDLRSPLVNLQGFSRELEFARAELERILVGDGNPEGRERARTLISRDVTESVHYIQTAVSRLSNIIDALLRLSRAGRVEYHPKLVELKPLILRIVEAMRGSIVERGAEVMIQDLPPVWGDPTAIEQIFANLIGNAVNYLDPKRAGRIEIGSVERAVEGLEKALTFYVKDNGLGIAEAYLPKVFAIFQRLHGNVASGEGVGLALVRRVVERHGGQVWVESTEGVGSTFFVAFPAAPQFSPLPAVAPRKERITLPAPPKNDHETSNHPAGRR